MVFSEIAISKICDLFVQKMTDGMRPIMSLVKTHRGATIYHKSITALIQVAASVDDDKQAPIYEYENDTADPIAIEVIQIALDGDQGLNNNPYFRIDILSSLGKITNLFEIDDNGHGGNYAPLTLGGVLIDLQANPLYLKPREKLTIHGWESNGVQTYGTVSIRLGAA